MQWLFQFVARNVDISALLGFYWLLLGQQRQFGELAVLWEANYLQVNNILHLIDKVIQVWRVRWLHVLFDLSMQNSRHQSWFKTSLLAGAGSCWNTYCLPSHTMYIQHADKPAAFRRRACQKKSADMTCPSLLTTTKATTEAGNLMQITWRASEVSAHNHLLSPVYFLNYIQSGGGSISGPSGCFEFVNNGFTRSNCCLVCVPTWCTFPNHVLLLLNFFMHHIADSVLGHKDISD